MTQLAKLTLERWLELAELYVRDRADADAHLAACRPLLHLTPEASKQIPLLGATR